MVEELPVPSMVVEQPLVNYTGVADRSVEAMWQRDMVNLRRPKHADAPTPWDKLPAGKQAWDDIC